MSAHRIVGAILLFIALLGGGAILGVGLTQGQEPDTPDQSAAALGSGFTYQGELTSEGAPINNTCDITARLYDAASGGNQVGSAQTVSNVTVSDGRFTVLLNDAGQFGRNAFNGDARWLDISVQCDGDASATHLGRQALTATPYATFAAYALHTEGSPYANVVVVAHSGGDFDTIQAALNSITDASDQNRYLVWVAPASIKIR
ncbi:MAG TPA: hypothetical protein VK879_19910 [Candidatus Sulfomarinibacteraceae bacterium]|nr:hypothetical protein [Candidatus Sulfomarinibacteraceae bacterium]